MIKEINHVTLCGCVR